MIHKKTEVLRTPSLYQQAGPPSQPNPGATGGFVVSSVRVGHRFARVHGARESQVSPVKARPPVTPEDSEVFWERVPERLEDWA